jgi:hypothetical protein
MDAQLREILRRLAVDAPDIYEMLMLMLSGSLTRAELVQYARSIANLALDSGFPSDIMRALAMILRILGLRMPSLEPTGTIISGGTAAGSNAAVGGAAAGDAVAGGAAAGDAAAGAAAGDAAGAAAGGAAMTVGAALFLLFALGVLSYRVYNELTQEIDVGSEGGVPCAGTTSGKTMALSPREIVTSNWKGRKASMQSAIDEARKDCLRLYKNCDGLCPGPLTCKPVLAVQSIYQWSSFPWFTTYTRIIYTCPCICVEPNGYWGQWDWSELPDAAKDDWKKLGWNADNWDGEPPGSASKSWRELSEEERNAAQSLGYNQTSWDMK